jgi:carotenoid cleavage dioxygenase-like enzyme
MARFEEGAGHNGDGKDPTNKAVGEGRDVAALWRWIVDVDAGHLVSSQRMSTHTSDFPCINPNFTGSKEREEALPSMPSTYRSSSLWVVTFTISQVPRVDGH